MFVPSKTVNALPPIYGQKGYIPIPDHLGRGEYCKECHQYMGWWYSVMAPKDTPTGTLRIGRWAPRNGIIGTVAEPRLEIVCKACHRWTGYDWGQDSSKLTTSAPVVEHTKSDWRAYRAELFKKLPQHIALFVYKRIRQQFYDQRTAFHWTQQFSFMEREWLTSQITKLSMDDDFVDNERVANKAKSNQRIRYWRQAKNGCCGSRDKEVFCWWNGQTYLLGWNYGH